jgi:octaprenyl-diphosphate synthase
MMNASRKTESPPSIDTMGPRVIHRAGRSDFRFSPEPWIVDLIAQVEDKLLSEARSDIQLVDAMSRYMLFGRAKRLRPLFVLLAQLIFKDRVLESAVDCAVATELIHCATLFHDDVIDRAETRKGQLAANAVWDNRSAVIMGDHFLVRAYTLLAAQGDFRLIDLFIETCQALAEGVMLEIEHIGDLGMSEETHLRIITDKTATFFATAARAGGYLAGASDEDQRKLEDIGLNFGLAFQLSDDLLDLFADPSVTGKPRGSDLSSGIYTTAVIRAMKCDPALTECLAARSENDGQGIEEIEGIAEMIRRNGSLEYTHRLVHKYCDKALDRLEKLPQGKANDAFRALVQTIRSREY